MTRRASIPIACTLTPADAEAQAGEWVALHGQLIAVEAVPGGRRLRFPASLSGQVRDLAQREATCCAFLDIAVTVQADSVEITITSVNPDAAPVIDLLAGISP